MLSKKFYTEHSFTEPSLTPPIGTGPYIVDKITPGKSISYKKNKYNYINLQFCYIFTLIIIELVTYTA